MAVMLFENRHQAAVQPGRRTLGWMAFGAVKGLLIGDRPGHLGVSWQPQWPRHTRLPTSRAPVRAMLGL